MFVSLSAPAGLSDRWRTNFMRLSVVKGVLVSGHHPTTLRSTLRKKKKEKDLPGFGIA